MTNIKKSLLFYKSLRLSLCNENKEMNKYLMEEASDYEILSLVLTGKKPDEKSNIFSEMYLFDQFKKQIRENYYSIQDNFEMIDEILTDVGPIEHLGYSSIKEQFGKWNNISESKYWNNKIESFEWLDILSENHNIIDSERRMAELLYKFSKVRLEQCQTKTDLSILENTVLRDIIHEATFEEYKERRQDLKKKKQQKEEELKAEKDTVEQNYSDQMNDLNSQTMADGASSIANKALGAASAASSAIYYGRNIKGVSDSIKAQGGLTNVVRGTAAGIANTAGGAASNVAGLFKTAASYAARGAQAVSGVLGKATVPLGIAALGGMLLYGAMRTYQNHFSQAARACANMADQDKKTCMQNAKQSAIRAQINDLRSSMNACNHTKNPIKCKEKINKKIFSLNQKLSGL